jgi:hypothetical protein
MSEMTLFSKGGNTLPAHLRNLELDETTKALMGSGGASGKRISIKGGVFRMIVDGKEIAQNEDRAMNIVIVAANANVSRSYYEDTYVEGQVLAPTCWSNDGISPDTKVSEPQSGKCASCPQNIAGSAESGKGRACRFSQRLAVTLENDLKGDVYQLTLPAQSIFGNVENGKMPLQAYAKFLGSHGLPITAIVTEMRFDTASATPKLTFKAVRPLEADEMAVAQEKGQSPEAKTAIANNPATLDGAKPKAVAAPAPAPKAEAEEPEAPAAEPTKRAKKAAPKDVADILDDWAE